MGQFGLYVSSQIDLWEAPGLVGVVHQSFSHNECVQSQTLCQPFYIDYSTNVATPVQHALNGQSVRRRLLNKDTKESAFANIEGFSQPLVGKPVVSKRFQQQSLVSLLTADGSARRQQQNVKVLRCHAVDIVLSCSRFCTVMQLIFVNLRWKLNVVISTTRHMFFAGTSVIYQSADGKSKLQVTTVTSRWVETADVSEELMQGFDQATSVVVMARLTSYKMKTKDLARIAKMKSLSVILHHSEDRARSYIVKIHDAGLIGPIFKVFLEEYPNESFMDVSADKCWELVLQRPNQQIINGCKLDLQPIKCLNRLEMCGLSNPALVQAIEDLDPEHRYLEYWSNKVDHNEAMKLTFSMFSF
nr:lysine-specific demethylase JMJ18 [Tanacetum cinerariifolium]